MAVPLPLLDLGHFPLQNSFLLTLFSTGVVVLVTGRSPPHYRSFEHFAFKTLFRTPPRRQFFLLISSVGSTMFLPVPFLSALLVYLSTFEHKIPGLARISF